MSEDGTSAGAMVEVEPTVGIISGSKRPEAAGHRFGPELTCIECGKTWDTHQVDPTVCTPQPDFAAQYQTQLKGEF